MKRWQVLGLLSLALFIGVFGFYTRSVGDFWFQDDDLGIIVNGMIKTPKDFVRVFSVDERTLLVPQNYSRSKANVIAGFLRPLKSVFFTIIATIWGIHPVPFYLFHVAVHALNAVLFFILIGYFVPLWLAWLAAFTFAFYSGYSWLTWVAATHNSLAIFFMFLSLIFFYNHWRKKEAFGSPFSGLSFLSGCMFLLSLLSREDAIVMPIAVGFVLGLYFLLDCKKTFVKSFLQAFWQSSAFIVVYVIYVLWRYIAFGVESLDRTINNLLLRFPFLQQWFGTVSHTQGLQKSVITNIDPIVQSGIAHEVILEKSIFSVIFDWFLKKGMVAKEAFFKWAEFIFFISPNSLLNKLILVGLVLFILVGAILAFRRRKSLFFSLLFTLLCGSWQGFLAYPCIRYLNLYYPCFIFFLVITISFLLFKEKKGFVNKLFGSGLLMFLVWGGLTGVQRNKGVGADCPSELKKRYEQFFQEYGVRQSSNVVVIGSPFVSDVETAFQYFSKNYQLKLVHELFSTIAEQGTFGCRRPYRKKGVGSIISPIDGGFRFTSLDKEHCGWWIHYSDHPIAWSEKDRAYRWTSEPYEDNVWYPCSIGKFMIHEKIDQQLVTDISFVFDKKWIHSDTVFVGWNSMEGIYILLNGDHLKPT